MGSIYRVRSLCSGLTKLFHKCYVFTPFNYYEDWGPLVKFITVPIISSGKISKQFYRIIRKILDIRNLSNTTILNPKILNLTISQVTNCLIDTIQKNNIDFDVFIGETEIGGLILTKIKDKFSFPVIADYHNFWPEELVDHRIIRRYGRRYNYLIDLEKEVLANSDMIFTVSETLKNFLLKKFKDIDRSKLYTEIIGGYALLDKPKKKNLPPKIINAGMVVHRSNFKYFFDSLPYVLKKYPETQIYVTKKGEKLKETMNLAKKKKLKINFYWKNTHQEFIELLSHCHVGVVTSTYELTRKFGFVTKIYDYFSVGIPVVGNDIGGWTKVISEEKLGILSSRDPKDLAEKIMIFIENPELGYEYGQRGIEFLKEKHNVVVSAKNIIKHIKNIQ
ncbi:MAG: glycosyltransferase family 4 protein [Promethearchaeota archaeon]